MIILRFQNIFIPNEGCDGCPMSRAIKIVPNSNGLIPLCWGWFQQENLQNLSDCNIFESGKREVNADSSVLRESVN